MRPKQGQGGGECGADDLPTVEVTSNDRPAKAARPTLPRTLGFWAGGGGGCRCVVSSAGLEQRRELIVECGASEEAWESLPETSGIL